MKVLQDFKVSIGFTLMYQHHTAGVGCVDFFIVFYIFCKKGFHIILLVWYSYEMLPYQTGCNTYINRYFPFLQATYLYVVPLLRITFPSIMHKAMTTVQSLQLCSTLWNRLEQTLNRGEPCMCTCFVS